METQVDGYWIDGKTDGVVTLLMICRVRRAIGG
jgi:hypothetical protein